MSRIRVARIPVITCLLLTVALATTGCSLVSKYDYSRAQKLEAQGRNQEALDLYLRALTRVPEGEQKLRSEIYLHMGDCWLRLAEPNQAFAAFQKAAALDANNVPAHLRLGEMFLAGGAADRASEQAQTVLQLASASPDGLTLLGAASSAAGDMNLAMQAFEKVLQADPQRVRVAVALADIYNERDDTDKAREILRKAVEAKPQSSIPLLALGRLEEELGHTSAAEVAYRAAVKAEDTVDSNTRLASFLARTSRPDEATRVLLHADSLNRQLPVGRADFKLLAGDPVSALDSYMEVLNSPRFDAPVKRSWMPSSFSTEGTGQDKDRARMAVRIIEADLQIAANASAADPSMIPATSAARLHFSQYRNELDQATAEILQAEIALADNDLVAAMDHAKRAVQAGPESAAAHYINGLAEYRSGDAGAGRAEWVNALEQEQSYAPARLALAQDAAQNGKYEDAEGYIVPVVRDEPENFHALTIFGSVLLGLERYASAELIGRRAVMINPRGAEGHLLLGDIASAQRHFATALYEYEKAISLAPRSREAMQGLLRLYSNGRISRPMIAKLERVAETDPPSAPLLEMAARLYARYGWQAEAERCLKRAIQVDPYRVTAIQELAQFKVNRGEADAALDLGARKGGPDAALLRAVRAERRNDLNTAASEYESAIRQGERSGVAANNLAWLLAKHDRDLDRALDAAQKAQALAPNSAAVLDTLGFVYLQRREYSAAIPVLKKAIELAQKNGATTDRATIQTHLEEAYLRSGEKASLNDKKSVISR